MPIGDIPQELTALERWLQYYLVQDPAKPDKKPVKHPCLKYRLLEHKKNLKTLDHLLKRRPQAGFQFLVDKRDGFVFVDIDHCRDKDTCALTPEAEAIVDSLNTFCEISASGTGLHLVCRGSLPEDFHVEGNPVEIYSGNIPNKLIAMTGDVLDLNFNINDRQSEIETLLAKCRASVAPAGTPAPPFDAEELVIESAADRRPTLIEWLWPDKIPLSHLTLFAGNMDVGKSLVWTDIVARVTRFLDFPTGKIPEGVGGEVIVMAEEDDYDSVLVPRLMAAGADLKSVFFINKVAIGEGAKRRERLFAFDADMAKLEKLIEKEGHLCQLIVIDPISDYFGKGKSMNEKQDVREILNRLGDLCKKYRMASIIVEHFNKRTDVSAKHKTGGSVALTAKPRAAFMFAELPKEEAEDGSHSMTFIKGNLSTRKVGLRYSITAKPVKVWSLSTNQFVDSPTPHVVWQGEETRSADEVLAAEKESRENGGGKRERCIGWLKETLAAGDRLSREVYAEAEEAGFSEKTVKRALRDGGFPEPKQRRDGWYMRGITSGKPAQGVSNGF